MACSAWAKADYQVITAKREQTIDKHGQFLLAQEISLEDRWTYLDLERLPSGKFAPNALTIALGAFAYNILRLIGQMGLLGQHAPIRHPAKRRGSRP